MKFSNIGVICAIMAMCVGCSKVDTSAPMNDAAESLPKSECSTNECVEAAGLHGGKFSVHRYEFTGRAAPHTQAAIEQYGLDDDDETRGAQVHAKWTIQWPEAECGVVKEALPRIHRDILLMIFGAHFVGEDVWQPPATIEETKTLMKARISKCFADDPSEKDHICSRLEFDADTKLSWPFGTTPRENAKWYEKPVLSVINDGYANDGGNGCHSYTIAATYSLPDGRKLTLDDYFPKHRQKELSSAIWKRVLYDTLGNCEEARVKEDRELDPDEEGHMFVGANGIRWIFVPYTFFAGCYGTTNIEMTWEELEKFL